MRAFIRERGRLAPLPRDSIDTDQIMPRAFVKGIERTGYGNYLFDVWRHQDEGWLGKEPSQRQPVADFVLNDPSYVGAKFLYVGADFGCGSSREHAVWGLLQYGFCAILGLSFSDLFRENALRNGLLLITLEPQQHSKLGDLTQREVVDLEVDLERRLISRVDTESGDLQLASFSCSFDFNEQQRQWLLQGLDDIGLSLQHQEAIEQWEQADEPLRPWLYGRMGALLTPP